MARVRTAVVHLVRAVNGLAPFEVFMGSYERCAAGLEHELVLLFKGFGGDPAGLLPYLARAGEHRPGRVEVSDAGFDLTAYVAAASVLEHERLCFVNSFSEILVPGWLGLLDGALADTAVGAAGATGSWASHLSYGLYQAGLRGGPYAEAFESRRAARHAMHALSGSTPASAPADWLYNVVMTACHSTGMALFPAAHLRTNAFLVDRALLGSLRTGRARTKWATYHLESGRRSLTSQLRARGRPPVVVDRAGVARPPDDWHAGDVFWQAGQEDLLVADNQTRSYAAATAGERAVLSAHAWGPRARPGGGAP
ncbi:MAG: hypothetical protein ACRDLN_10720 [Solirubrobacteraceae bacterium]